MAYTRPDGDAADFEFSGVAYTRPAGDAANFSFEPEITSVEATGAAVIGPVTAAATTAHGISAVGAAVIGPVTAAGVAEHTSLEVFVVGAAIIGPVTAAGVVAHGIAGVGAAVIGPITTAAQAAHGVSVAGAALIGPVTAAGLGAHGITATGAAVIGPLVAVGVARHPRYSLKGDVRDGGVLVNRTVRAYLRSSGALIGEQMTIVGRFDIHAGFTEAEHYVLPIDLSSDATDFTPPVANRLLSVLVVD